ncbi:hypothetical protein QFC19_000644 [Naganishia cerealis]|uniref:Uncharacterized protein n=1 Tax=Naganishia cerealis TaxID=610337 RepID=A0ACC2WN31_9TREE|nr:hypothetical protein QFC19_000644 [Naganishia cerealis]
MSVIRIDSLARERKEPTLGCPTTALQDKRSLRSAKAAAGELTRKKLLWVTFPGLAGPSEGLAHGQSQIQALPLDMPLSGALDDDFGRVQHGTLGAFSDVRLGFRGVPPYGGGGAGETVGAGKGDNSLHCVWYGVSTKAIAAHLASLSEETFTRLKTSHGVSGFPLTFPTVRSEINFLAVLSLLNTLSGYRAPLHAATGQGAYQNVVKLLFGLYISVSGDAADAEEGGLLSARGLAKLDAQTVEGIWGISTFEEKPHPDLPGVTVGVRGGVMYEVVGMVVEACNQTGEILVKEGWKSLGEFVERVLQDAEQVEGELERADYMVEKVRQKAPGQSTDLPTPSVQIVTLIPGFRDMSTVLNPAQPVYIFKKAFFLLFALQQRLTLRSLSNPNEKIPRLPDASVLPMFVDNVLPTMCVHLGYLDMSACSFPALREWGAAASTPQNNSDDGNGGGGEKEKQGVREGPSLTREEAYVVRAAALDAGRIAVQRAHELALAGEEGLAWLGEMTEADLGKCTRLACFVLCYGTMAFASPVMHSSAALIVWFSLLLLLPPRIPLVYRALQMATCGV